MVGQMDNQSSIALWTTKIDDALDLGVYVCKDR